MYSNSGGYYLPPSDSITYDFVRGVLSGDKRLLKSIQVINTYIPSKLSVVTCQDLWSEVLKEPSLMRYFPTSKKYPSKTYLISVGSSGYQILSSLKPQLLSDILKLKKENRKEHKMVEKKIKIADEVATFLKSNSVVCRSTKSEPMTYLAVGRKWASHGQSQRSKLTSRPETSAKSSIYCS